MPPKKSNKGCYNGFYYFMSEYKNKKGISMHQAADEAGAIWKNMNASQKKPYNDRAAEAKQRDKGVKKTALNEDIAMVQLQELEEKQAEQRMQTDIRNTIKRFIVGETVQTEFFHVMHINIFCRVTTTGRYYPAELGLLRFNFQDGVLEKNIYHTMVQPGSLPKGYALNAKIISEETHKITPPCFDEVESNMFDVMAGILSFMKENQTDSTFPPIYVSNKHMKQISQILEQMCDDYEMASCFKVYSLEYLLFTIRNSLSDEIVWPTISQSIGELERDVYDYTPEISCSLHESCDAPLFCSKSIITRLTYIVCDNCCPMMGIRLIPGRHIPQNKAVAFNNTYATASYASTRDDNSSRSSSTERYSTAIEDECTSLRSRHGNNGYAESVYSMASCESVLRRPNKKSMSVVGSETASVRGGLGVASSSMNDDFKLPTGRGRGRRPM